jgi:outer membrane protein TolC
MNSQIRENGTRISLVLCVATSVVFGLLESNEEKRASAEPPKVVRIDGKDYPVATFVKSTLPTPPVAADLQPLKPLLESKVSLSELSGAFKESSGSPFSSQIADHPAPAKPSREMLGDYSALPEVNLELIRDMFAESTEASGAHQGIPITMVAHSLDGLGLTEIDEQITDQFHSPGTDRISVSQSAEVDREKQAIETLLKSINSPQTNLMQMQAVDVPQWLGQIHFAMLRYGSHTDLNLQDAIYTAIQFSPELEILRADVGISQAEITKQRAGFAFLNAAATQEQFIGGLQAHILNVIRAYWDLATARGRFVVLKRSYDRAHETATVVSNRIHLDVGPVQSARSEATLGARRAALLSSEYAVVLAQEKLLRLMFGQYICEIVNTEVIPTSSMIGPSRIVDMELELQLGLQCRPEVRQSLQVVKRTSIEQGVARNQLLPLLGLTMPVGNRVAKANLRQAQIRLVRFQKEFETVVSNITLEIRNACHNVANTTQQRDATAQAMNLVERELHVLKSRAELLLDGDNVGPLYLEDLLTTQERLAAAELAFLNASAAHALAYFELQRANGTLMRADPIPFE